MGRWIVVPALVALGVGLAAPASGGWSLVSHPVSAEMGLRLVETTAQLRGALGVEADHGALVLEVEHDGPAERAGLRAGDVVTRVAGTPVGSAEDILDALEGHGPGEAVQVQYVRHGKAETARVTLARARGGRMRFGRWSFSVPGFEMPEDLDRQLRRFRERVERQLRDLDQRLRRLEKSPEPDRTAL